MVAVKEKENVIYIKFSSRVWWALRKKFIQSMPSRVTENYLAGILNIAASTAKLTIIPPLKKPSGQRCRLSSNGPAFFEGNEQSLALVTKAKARELLALSTAGLLS